MTLYHYTDRLSLDDIRRDGRIRATSITLHRDLMGRDQGLTTMPIVWLTVDSRIESTVAGKMIAAGWPRGLIGDLCRIVVRPDIETASLSEHIVASAIDPDWWRMTVATAALVGSSHRDWRIVERDIASVDWVRIERLQSTLADDGSTEWERV